MVLDGCFQSNGLENDPKVYVRCIHVHELEKKSSDHLGHYMAIVVCCILKQNFNGVLVFTDKVFD